LEELLEDPRFPNTVRHLRKPFADPMTGQAEWGLAKAPESRRWTYGWRRGTILAIC